VTVLVAEVVAGCRRAAMIDGAVRSAVTMTTTAAPRTARLVRVTGAAPSGDAKDVLEIVGTCLIVSR
jgi:hypothetical protein